ncbi:aldehyde dehydrogenase family protein, partial [uncultured Maritalea sp.]|uniref:aldehyde dehydrogenase family protein n=1 Tax=uncultured Maritalea sp. TaxID=757249 RepID=UPI00261999C1
VIDPSTEEPCAVISLGDEADTNAAVVAARAAFPAWMNTPPSERIALVENEQRIRQAARSIKKFMADHEKGSNVVPMSK